MLIRHMDIRILACDLGKLRSGDGIHTYGTGYLCHIRVVAGLVQATHGVKQGDNLHEFICCACSPIDAYEPYPAVGGDGLQDSFAVHSRADIFQAQG